MNSPTPTSVPEPGALQQFIFGDTGASSLAQETDAIFHGILWFCIVWFVLLMGVMFYWVVKYRRRPGVPPQRSPHHNTRLELAWTILPSVFLGAMFYYGFRGYITNLVAPSNAEIVDVVGQKWDWTVTYDNGSFPPEKRAIGGKAEAPVIYAPVGRPIKFRITSRDVLHAFWIPDFRYKFDALPNRYSSFWIEALEEGEHWIFCAEYCGDYHSEMVALLKVVPAAEYDALKAQWYNDQQTGTPEELGESLAKGIGACMACHSTDGSANVGPTWRNAWGYPVSLADGSSVPGDDPDAWDNYARESILNPNAKIHAGYPSPSPMPPGAGMFTDEQVEYLIAYIRSLSDKAPAPVEAEEGAESADAPAEE